MASCRVHPLILDTSCVNLPTIRGMTPSSDPSQPSNAEGAAGAEPLSGGSAPAPSDSPQSPTAPNEDAPRTVDVTPEADLAANAGAPPTPLTPDPQQHQVLDYSPAGVPTPEDGNVPGQEQPAAPSRAPLVPESDTTDDPTDPTATVQQADHPIYGLAESPSVNDIAVALVAAWHSVKVANWNVVSDEMDNLIAKLSEVLGLDRVAAPDEPPAD